MKPLKCQDYTLWHDCPVSEKAVYWPDGCERYTKRKPPSDGNRKGGKVKTLS